MLPMDDDESPFGDACPFCNHLNQPAAGDVCAHHLAWVWDGALDVSTIVEAFRDAWTDAAWVVASGEESDAVGRFLLVTTASDSSAKLYIELADEDLSFEDILIKIAGAQAGSGWITAGMLGGSGYNIYAESQHSLVRATEWYRTLMAKATAVISPF